MLQALGVDVTVGVGVGGLEFGPLGDRWFRVRRSQQPSKEKVNPPPTSSPGLQTDRLATLQLFLSQHDLNHLGSC